MRKFVVFIALVSVSILGLLISLGSSLPNLHANVLVNVGSKKYKDKDFKGALDDCNKAIGMNPKSSMAYCSRGLVKVELKDYQGAVEDYDLAVEISPKYFKAYHHRGMVKELMGDLGGACEDWRKAVSLGMESSDQSLKDQCPLLVVPMIRPIPRISSPCFLTSLSCHSGQLQ
ncbi:MAG: tetratricopeptide repeat protein [Synechococcus sp.]